MPSCACVHTDARTHSEGTGWGAVWSCEVAAAYELTQMVSPSATPQSLGQRVYLCFTVSMRGRICMQSRASDPQREAEITVSHLSSPIVGPGWEASLSNFCQPLRDGIWSCGLLTEAGLIAEKIARLDGRGEWLGRMSTGWRTKDKASFHHLIASHQQLTARVYPSPCMNQKLHCVLYIRGL